MSAGMATHSPTSASSAAARAKSSALREDTTTFAPPSSRARAIISPIPREPPVTNAVFPSMSNRPSALIGSSIVELGRALGQERVDRLGNGLTERGHDLLAILVLD